jgi:hypothetical protein
MQAEEEAAAEEGWASLVLSLSGCLTWLLLGLTRTFKLLQGLGVATPSSSVVFDSL